MKTENNEPDLDPTPFLLDFDLKKKHSSSILSDTSDDCLEGMIVTTVSRRRMCRPVSRRHYIRPKGDTSSCSDMLIRNCFSNIHI